MCLFPLFGLLVDFIYTFIRNKNIKNNSTVINHYSTFHSSPSVTSSYHSSSSTANPLHSSQFNTSPSFHLTSRISSPLQRPPTPLRETIPTIFEEDFMSSEYVLLELAFDHVIGLTSVPLKVKTAVTNILDATEYCDVTSTQRKDPYFEPNIIKTLAYATGPIVQKLNDFKMANKCPPIPLTPPLYSLWMAILGFLYMCLWSLFVGWFPWYVIQYNQSVHQPANYPYLDHWNVMAVYYLCSLLGALSSIPLSIWISTTTILRIHLVFLLLSSISFILFVRSLNSFHYFLTGSAALGVALSSTSPSLITLLNDYGYTRYCTPPPHPVHSHSLLPATISP
jgi:hypothetical protein